jgi:hypothetical protein
MLRLVLLRIDELAVPGQSFSGKWLSSAFTRSLLHSTTFSENDATAKYEYPHAFKEEVRLKQVITQAVQEGRSEERGVACLPRFPQESCNFSTRSVERCSA